MTVREMFIGPDGLRAGWRFAAFAILWFGADAAVDPVVSLFHTYSATGFTPDDILAFELGEGLMLLALSWALARMERHGTGWFGLGWGRGSPGQFALGCLLGLGMVTLLFTASCLFGDTHLHGLAEHGAPLWRYLLVWIAGMLLIGLGEELLFRGYALASLTRGIGFWPAALLLSLLFGAAHLNKPMEDVPDILNIVLLGLALCYSVRQTGALWLAIGFHAAFDFFALSFYGSPNTGNEGLPLEHHLLDTSIAGPAWLTGGPQGLEASWLVAPLTLAMCLLLKRLYPQPRHAKAAK